MIEIRNLTKKLENNLVLNSLNLEIQARETTAIIGRSGCGKSVLLKHIIGIMKPDEGEILVDGADVTKLSEEGLYELRKKFGMVFQGAALFDSLTVAENVSFALKRYTDLSKSEIETIVREKLALVGLKGIEHLKPAALSGGMKKRVGLARAIAMNPQIILYDEPTTGLDPIMADAINELIVSLHKNLGTTSIVVTHDMVSAYKIANRIAMLYNGTIIEIGTPKEIQNTKNETVRQFILGQSEGPISILE